ncbi:MAG: site-specific DNA-methyltransferase [Novosphingobium sp.]|nr:site-specific DNA-methyltransferase [Novosphingobium sp.]
MSWCSCSSRAGPDTPTISASGESGRYRINIVRYAGANSFRKGRARDLADHSTIKPTGLVADFILDCSNRGALVVDPTVGSGTALRRLADASGLTPVLANDDRSFAEIAEARRARNKPFGASAPDEVPRRLQMCKCYRLVLRAETPLEELKPSSGHPPYTNGAHR